jgi:uncharacterized caspase-like protein
MSLRFIIKLAALASTCWLSVSQALAENRIALVIGNSNYTAVTALPNPANDAKAMSRFLRAAGFEVVEAPDLTQSDMRRTIGNFANAASDKGPDTVALVFYAGHGLQVDGENYLVPVDARIEREADVPLQAVRLADVMNALSTIHSKSNIVILDACRNNPFSAINKTTGRGLAIVDAPNGSLVSYSTAPGTEALDGDKDNSPYTAALTKIGQEPGLPIEQLLKRVRLDVSNATERQQYPWESSSLTAEFSFFPTGSGQERISTASNTASGAGAKPRTDTRSVEAWQKELKGRSAREAYDIVVREDKIEAYQAYLALYSSQSLAPLVRTVLDRRLVMVDWYKAVTVNTVASYQVFLTTYGSSDFAWTANRLIERARGRSISDPAAAFASANATCPCSLPASPSLRQRRTDVAPTQNTTPNPGSSATKPSGTGVATINPTPTIIYTDPVPPVVTPPPVVVIPPRIGIHPKPPRGDDYPKPTGGNDNPKPTGGNDNPKPTTGGNDHPRPTGGGNTYPNPTGGKDYPTKTTGGASGSTTILRGKIDNPKLRVSNTAPTNTLGAAKSPLKAFASPMSGTTAPRAAAMTPKPSFGLGLSRGFGGGGMSRMGFGRH